MRPLDTAIAYLHETGLEASVQKALVAVVNERVTLQKSGTDPRARLCELLQPTHQQGGGGASSAALKERDNKIAELERQVATLRLRQQASATGGTTSDQYGALDQYDALEEQNARLVADKAELEAQNATLLEKLSRVEADNAGLQKDAKVLTDQAEELMQNNQRLEQYAVQLQEDHNKLEAMLSEISSGHDAGGPSYAPQSTPARQAPPPQPQPQPPRQPQQQQPAPRGDQWAEVIAALQGTMGRLFDVLAKSRGGMLSRPRVLAFTTSLRQGCDASENPAEKRAMSAFISILEQLVQGREQCSRHVWLEHVRAKGTPGSADGYTMADAQTFVGILVTILDNDEAVEGLLETMEEEEESLTLVTPEYRTMMQRLYDEVLDTETPAGTPAGTVLRTRLNEFATALQKGCEASDDEEERDAMLAFVKVLKSITAQRAQCTRAEWQAHVPSPGSFTADQAGRFIEIVTTILDTPEAVDGLLETMRGG